MGESLHQCRDAGLGLKVSFKVQSWKLSYEAPKLHISGLIPSTDLVLCYDEGQGWFVEWTEELSPLDKEAWLYRGAMKTIKKCG